MKVLLAIDSFKGSLTSVECSIAIAEGIRDAVPSAQIISVPLADGGEGTVDALVHATQGTLVEKIVIGPLGSEVHAGYGILGDGTTAVIEVAAACGLPLVPGKERNPYYTTTFGVGQLISDAIEKGCHDFVIGLGGSATNDAGVGMLQALGFSFLDLGGNEVGYGGYELHKIIHIDTTGILPELKNCSFKVACDVHNPLYGLNGAAHIFGPQKGATPEMVEVLDTGLKHFSETTFRYFKKDIQTIPGAGAAGGLGAAFAGYLNAQLLSGVELILETAQVEGKLKDVEFIITGEGKLDEQTSLGKAPIGVARLASKYGIPVIALTGGYTEQASQLNELGITSYFSIQSGPTTLEKALDPKVTKTNLRTTAKQIFNLISTVKNIGK